MHPLIVIPARFGSIRIPGKPLCLLNGKPLLQLVAEQVLSFELDAEVVVATDDVRVERAAAAAGVRAVTTSVSHRCGTERVAEVLQMSDFRHADPILNVQGDQPFLPREAAVGALRMTQCGFPIGSAAAPLLDCHEQDRNRVKVGVEADGTARFFSRDLTDLADTAACGVFLHIGVYAYTREALLEWVSLPPSTVEIDEGLEQMRPFLHGIPVGIAVLDGLVEAGIDTLEDLARARDSLAPTRKEA